VNKAIPAGLAAAGILLLVTSAHSEPDEKPIVAAQQTFSGGTVAQIGLDIRVVPRINRRAIIDASIINIFIVNRNRLPPETYAATTAQSIDAWTATVQHGSASGFGTVVDQWVSLVYSLDEY